MSTEPTVADFNSLAAKLDSLDLTDAESVILVRVLERAAAVDEDEVAGLAYVTPDSKALADSKAVQLSRAFGVDFGMKHSNSSFKWATLNLDD